MSNEYQLRKQYETLGYKVVTIEEINPDDDTRVQLDRQRAAQIPESNQCQYCGGTGNELLFMYRQCVTCGGSGRI